MFYQYRDAVKVNKDSYQNKGVEPLNTENIKACGAKTYRSHILKPSFCQGEIMACGNGARGESVWAGLWKSACQEKVKPYLHKFHDASQCVERSLFVENELIKKHEPCNQK